MPEWNLKTSHRKVSKTQEGNRAGVERPVPRNESNVREGTSTRNVHAAHCSPQLPDEGVVVGTGAFLRYVLL